MRVDVADNGLKSNYSECYNRYEKSILGGETSFFTPLFLAKGTNRKALQFTAVQAKYKGSTFIAHSFVHIMGCVFVKVAEDKENHVTELGFRTFLQIFKSPRVCDMLKLQGYDR